MTAPKKRGTTTSNFGVGKRESHDATAFYERFAAPELSGDDTVVAPYEIADPFVNSATPATWTRSTTVRSRSSSRHRRTSRASSTKRSSSATACRARTSSTSQLLTDVFAECARKLEPGGRIAVNVANLGRKPYRSLAADVIAHPAGRPAPAAARRGRVAQGRRRGRQLRVGFVPQPGQPGAARHDRTRRHREQGPLRPRASTRRPRARAACRSRTTSTPTSSWPRRSTSGTSRPRARAASSHPAPFPVELPGAADRPLHVRERPRARPVHGFGLDARRRRALRPPLRRLRPRPDVRRHRAPARPRRRHARTARRAARAADARSSPSSTSTRASKRAPRRKARPRRRSPRSCSPKPASDRRQELARARHRRHDQLHRDRRRRRRVVLRRVGRVHEHARRAAAHRHRVEDARPRARARGRRQRAARVPHVAPAAQGQRGRHRAAQRRATSFFDAIEMRSDAEGYERLRKYAAGGHDASDLRSGRPPDDDHRGRHRPRDVRRRRRRRRARGAARGDRATSSPTVCDGCSARGRKAATATSSPRRS